MYLHKPDVITVHHFLFKVAISQSNNVSALVEAVAIASTCARTAAATAAAAAAACIAAAAAAAWRRLLTELLERIGTSLQAPDRDKSQR